MKNKGRQKLILFLGIIIGILYANHRFGWSMALGNIDNLLMVQERVADNKAGALFLYIILTIVGCVALALPGVTFALVAGILFGPWLGTWACLVATTLGAALAFLVGRFFLKDSIKPMLEKNKILKKLLFSDNEKSDLVLLMITRMIPIFPYNLQNFAYGITNIGFLKYTILTFLFMLPGVAFFTIGSAGLVVEEDKWIYFLVAAGLALLVTGIGVLLKKKYVSNESEEEYSGN